MAASRDEPDPVSIANRLRPILLQLNRLQLRREAHPLGVTGGQARPALRRDSGRRASASVSTAAREGISPAGMSGHIDRLVRAGLVQRRRGTRETAPVGIELTQEGERVLRLVRSRRTARLRLEAQAARARRARRRVRRRGAARGYRRRPRMTALVAVIGRRTFASLTYRNYRLPFARSSRSPEHGQEHRDGLARSSSLTQSPVAVGVMLVASSCPSPSSGSSPASSSTGSTRGVVIGTQVASMGLASALAGIALAGLSSPWPVYVLAALRGTVLVLDAPA